MSACNPTHMCLMVKSYFVVLVSWMRPWRTVTGRFGLVSGLGRAKLGLAGCLQLFPSTVWWGLYPIHGECLEQWCSCASNCAHLHSPHHPPRRPENRRFQRARHGSSGTGVDRRKGQERELEGQASRAPEQSYINSLHDRFTSLVLFQTLGYSLAERMPLLTSSRSSSCTTAIKQNALFMKPFSQIHIAT